MQKDDFLRITYEANIKGGQKFDAAKNIPIVVGGGYSLKGVEEQLLEMKVGQKKIFEVVPEKAFGKRDAALMKLVPLAEFRKHGTRPVPGMMVEADNKRGRVLSVSGGRVRVDFNHPLAGKILVYDVEVLKKLETKEEKIKSLVEIFTRITDKVEVRVNEKVGEIQVPPMVNSIIKKKIADEAMKLLGLNRIVFLEIFDKPEEKKKEKVEEKKL